MQVRVPGWSYRKKHDNQTSTNTGMAEIGMGSKHPFGF